jgi:hypothetical protein
MNERNNTETGYRELFIEGSLPPPVDVLADVLTPDELFRRFLAASPGFFRSNAEVLQKLGIDVVRSHVALVNCAANFQKRINAVLNLIAYTQRAELSSADPSDACIKSWVIDQIARMLAGDLYDKLVEVTCDGGKYPWDLGQAP